MGARTIPFEQVEAHLLQDPETRRAYEELELAYQIARLRISRGLTQQELADRVGTKQPSIARLESGRTNPSIGFVGRVLDALGGSLSLEIEPEATPEPDTDIGNVFTWVRIPLVLEIKSGAEQTESINVINTLSVAL